MGIESGPESLSGGNPERINPADRGSRISKAEGSQAAEDIVLGAAAASETVTLVTDSEIYAPSAVVATSGLNKASTE